MTPPAISAPIIANAGPTNLLLRPDDDKGMTPSACGLRRLRLHTLGLTRHEATASVTHVVEGSLKQVNRDGLTRPFKLGWRLLVIRAAKRRQLVRIGAPSGQVTPERTLRSSTHLRKRCVCMPASSAAHRCRTFSTRQTALAREACCSFPEADRSRTVASGQLQTTDADGIQSNPERK